MSSGLADTSVFVALENSRPIDLSRLPDQLSVSVVTTGELRAGVLAATTTEAKAQRLATLIRALEINPIEVDEPVAAAWAHLRVALRDLGRRLPVNDSWIAATAIAHGLTLVTQDQDFVGIPGLEVVVV